MTRIGKKCEGEGKGKGRRREIKGKGEGKRKGMDADWGGKARVRGRLKRKKIKKSKIERCIKMNIGELNVGFQKNYCCFSINRQLVLVIFFSLFIVDCVFFNIYIYIYYNL